MAVVKRLADGDKRCSRTACRMRKVHSTDLESSSQIPIWIVLVFSGLVLVMFFGWILKDLSALISPDREESRINQQLSDNQPVSGSGVLDDLYKIAINQVDRRVPSNSSPSVNSDKARAIQTGKPAPDSARGSTAQPIQEVADQSADDRPKKNGSLTGSDPMQQLAAHDSAERFNYQQPSVELFPSERNGQPAAKQEPRIIADEIDNDKAGSSSELSMKPEGTVLPGDSTAQTDNVESATTTPANPEPSHTQPPSADMEALRQLITEATTNDVRENENALATHERGEALESLNALSAAIQFAPGSKVASEPVITALKQIEMILTDYPGTMISVLVATNESGDDKQDMLLSQERGRTLIAKLVNGGVALSRFSLQAQTVGQLPANTHRVAIQVHLKS